MTTNLNTLLTDLPDNLLAVGKDAGRLAEHVAVERLRMGGEVVLLALDTGTNWSRLSPWLRAHASTDDEALEVVARATEILTQRNAVMRREGVSYWGRLSRSVRDAEDIDELTVIVEGADELLAEYATDPDTAPSERNELHRLNLTRFLILNRLSRLAVAGPVHGISVVATVSSGSPSAIDALLRRGDYGARILMYVDRLEACADTLLHLAPEDAEVFAGPASEGLALVSNGQEIIKLSYEARSAGALIDRLRAGEVPKVRSWRMPHRTLTVAEIQEEIECER
jgi:hypothetical protein